MTESSESFEPQDRAETPAVSPAARRGQDGDQGDGQGRGWQVRRRRRANAPGGRRHQHKVLVTPEEEAQLLQLSAAQGVSIPRLLVESALAGGAETAAGRRNVIEELFAVHRLLATIANNVNQIARATNATLETQPETFATLAAVRRVAERIDDAVDELSP